MPKSLLKRFSLLGVAKQAGFTMIELLVVISVIGVLAVAVLSSINPIEQINKGRDTRTRSDAAQLINAIDRYVAIHEDFPWNVDYSSGANSYTAPANAEFTDLYEMAETDWSTANFATSGWAEHLVDTSEVKEGFIGRQREEENLLIIKPDGYDENVYTCFLPTSNAFRAEAEADCSPTGKNTTLESAPGVTTSLCGVGAGNADNYICLP